MKQIRRQVSRHLSTGSFRLEKPGKVVDGVLERNSTSSIVILSISASCSVLKKSLRFSRHGNDGGRRFYPACMHLFPQAQGLLVQFLVHIASHEHGIMQSAGLHVVGWHDVPDNLVSRGGLAINAKYLDQSSVTGFVEGDIFESHAAVKVHGRLDIAIQSVCSQHCVEANGQRTGCLSTANLGDCFVQNLASVVEFIVLNMSLQKAIEHENVGDNGLVVCRGKQVIGRGDISSSSKICKQRGKRVCI